MQVQRMAKDLDSCVPVSTAGTLESNSWSLSSNLDIAECINCLIDAGYSLGCDGELLPPKWAHEAFKEADA